MSRVFLVDQKHTAWPLLSESQMTRKKSDELVLFSPLNHFHSELARLTEHFRHLQNENCWEMLLINLLYLVVLTHLAYHIETCG